MNKHGRVSVSVISGLAVVVSAHVAFAQEVPTTPPPATSSAPGVQAATNAATVGAGGTDHDRVLNQIGLRYFGAINAPGPMGAPGATVHNIGVRYWISRMIAIEGGVGLAFSTTSVMGSMMNVTRFGYGLTGGVAINLAATQHLAIHIIPNLTFGMPSVDPLLTSLTIGADAAAELHFGFIGVPQMSLQARFGLNMNLLAGNGFTQFGFGTTAGSGSNVWDVIAASVAATYYFGR